ncbi:molecular chaperone DnaJ [candidate division WOR-1 bacterium RIFOXYA2_FULL_36_21]|uniref:Chaperone protein DnaJ n=1 Tax=candidate division WOR-1 bacterium RIFOXYB2_FULL_36_35 TaxID=1802578 RepID=A0A1F4S8S8_UNCSA|nr:MAG: molecular chaperone DnaJ [candidate division WOR-1 bacterium RIFOXYA2_FULL_36_21]OGC16814.1 MAG: molecular chaperone DnaJ [candidate division WOR-1 bacterium RIFOXYB2_FULL_36_35]OGC16965.1 MAG: molecular chaperone DnaJ [candidate division WOR-1 bacterium RIFOXYA12_FULL_36_13]
MANKDYYNILGVNKNASQDEIKKAFRSAARKYHPDVNKEHGSPEKFKEINEAYQVLGDTQKRQQYDQFGTAGPGFSGGEAGFSGFDFGDFSNFDGFGDIFDVFFGGQRRGTSRSGRQDGADLRYDLEVTLEEAFSGTEKEIEIIHLTACHTCKGSGAKPGTIPSKCSSCNGTGQIRRTQRTPLGAFSQVSTCPTCNGSGATITSTCSTCSGSGREKQKHTIKIKVPQGIESNYRLRVSGAGDAGIKGGAPGDLYVFVQVKENPVFEREGANLYTKQPIPFVKAALGSEIEVKAIDGTATLKIPAGTQSGTIFRFKEKGMHYVGSRRRGDFMVVIEIETPKNLTNEQKELLKKFGQIRREI